MGVHLNNIHPRGQLLAFNVLQENLVQVHLAHPVYAPQEPILLLVIKFVQYVQQALNALQIFKAQYLAMAQLMSNTLMLEKLNALHVLRVIHVHQHLLPPFLAIQENIHSQVIKFAHCVLLEAHVLH